MTTVLDEFCVGLTKVQSCVGICIYSKREAYTALYNQCFMCYVFAWCESVMRSFEFILLLIFNQVKTC